MARKKTANASLANAFGTLAYCSVVLQWLWAFLVTGYPLMMDSSYWTEPAVIDTPPEPIALGMPDPIIAVITAIAVLAVLGVSVYMVAALPKRIGKTGQAVTQKAASAIVPIITEHRKISEKKQRKLTVRTALAIKLTLIMIPLVTPYLIPGLTSIAPDVLAVLGLLGVATSLLLFGIQYLVAHVMRIPPTQLW